MSEKLFLVKKNLETRDSAKIFFRNLLTPVKHLCTYLGSIHKFINIFKCGTFKYCRVYEVYIRIMNRQVGKVSTNKSAVFIQ